MAQAAETHSTNPPACAPPAPALDPDRRLSDTVGPTAARRAIERGTLTPAFHRLAEAFLAADDAYQIPARAHNAAEGDTFRAKREPRTAPIPDALTHRIPAGTYMRGSETVALDELTCTMTTREDVLSHFKGDRASADATLAALAEWQQHAAQIDETSGLAAIVRREQEARELEESASDVLYEAKMAALQHPTVCLADIKVKRAMIAECLRMDVAPETVAVLEATFAAIRTACPPDAAISTAWDDAMARYLRASEAVEAHDAQARAADDRSDDIPEPLRAPCLHYAGGRRWQCEEELIDDLVITPAAKTELLPMLREHLICIDPRNGPRLTAEERAQIDAEEQASEILDTALWEAETALLDMGAPDVAAMIWKATMIERESDDDKFGFADLGLVAYYLSDCAYPERGRVAQYLDLLRLGDPDSPLLQLPAFSPRAWANAYEAEGGAVSHTPTGMIIVFPAEDTPSAAALRGELAATPWKYRALWFHVEGRWGTGGDPYFEASGRYRNDPDRMPRVISPGQPADRALRVDFATIDGAPAPVVEEIVNDPA